MAGDSIMASQEPTYIVAPSGEIHTRTSCMFCGLLLCICGVKEHIHETHPEILHLVREQKGFLFNNTISDKQILATTSLEYNPSKKMVELEVSASPSLNFEEVTKS